MKVMDVDSNADDHIDDLYVERRLSPGQSITRVRYLSVYSKMMKIII